MKFFPVTRHEVCTSDLVQRFFFVDINSLIKLFPLCELDMLPHSRMLKKYFKRLGLEKQPKYL